LKQILNLELARQYLSDGLIIAYPTEAVYGLGCDPFNEQAVTTLLNLKNRSADKGLILLISNWQQLIPLIDSVDESRIEKVRDSWPGPITWIFPKSNTIPKWISGEHRTIAIRMTSHPIARELCKNGPLVSTSANMVRHEPARTIDQLEMEFSTGIDAVIMGDVGSALEPSAIYDVLTGLRLR
jgi:L-threonylcarbamoyladenylate synthase